MTDDVKDLLGRAFGQEPPLRIDRDEVIQLGRKRLRRRRMFEAGGVVAAVVVVAIGAATLTNLTDSEPQRMPPAASRTQTAPPGPELPLPIPSTGTSPPQSTTTASPPSVPSTDQSFRTGQPFDANYLTELLYNVGGVSRKEVQQPPGGPPGLPAFQQDGAKYVFRADVSRIGGGTGSLDVTVDFAPGVVADCATLPSAYGDCEVRGRGELPVAVSEWSGPDGERRLLVYTVLFNGTRVAAIASNVTAHDREVGKVPTNAPPVFSTDQLNSLVVKVASSAR